MKLFNIYQNIYNHFKGGSKVDATQIIEMVKADLKTLDTDFLLENIKIACEEGQDFLENYQYGDFQDCLFIIKLACDEVFSRIQEYNNPDEFKELPNNVIKL